MELLKTIAKVPGYINWVRNGRPESLYQPKSAESPTDKARREINSIISGVLHGESEFRWSYSLNGGETELGDPPVWTATMPSWTVALPELNGKTLTYIHTETLVCDPEDSEHALTVRFRDLTTEWQFDTFLKNSDAQILVTRGGSAEKERSEYHGPEIQRLNLIKEAWQMAAVVRRHTAPKPE